jgi:hypothetical protein
MPNRTAKQKVVPPSSEQIAELTKAVITLTEQVRCLRLAVDEIEQELGWAIRTKVLDRLPPPQFPCDEQLWPNSSEEGLDEIEHVSDVLHDFENETSVLPTHPQRQHKLW